jgi:hypothetical protein
MSDDPEIIPPERGGLPATRREDAKLPGRQQSPIAEPTGVVSSMLTGFHARMQGRAYAEIAKNIRAQTEALDAETLRRESALKLRRTIHKLEEIDDILALDRAERKAEREAKYAELDYNRDERGHRGDVTKLRRERELQEARHALREANRNLFNADQGLENQQRLKQLNLEIWEKRAATEHMDAEKVRVLLSREIDGIKNPQPDGGEGTLDQLSEMRTSLERRAQEAAASGDASQAEKYLRLATQLDDLVVATLQGRTQK